MRSGLYQLSGCLLTGSEHSGIGGLLYIARISRKMVENRVYTAQGILERITVKQLLVPVVSLMTRLATVPARTQIGLGLLLPLSVMRRLLVA